MAAKRKILWGRAVFICVLILGVTAGVIVGAVQAVRHAGASKNASSLAAEEIAAPLSAPEYDEPLDEPYASYVEQIKQTYSYSPELAHIIEHIEQYSEDMLKTLLLRPEEISFLSRYPECVQYGLDNWKNIDVSSDYTPGEIPLFIQWDDRWGYEIYGSDVFGLNGCGPTCFAMVYVGLTGDTSQNPLSIGAMCIQNNYYYYQQGTGKELFDKGVAKYGLSSKQLPLTESAVLGSLRAGRPVVVNVGKGDFTSYGHYIVLTGVAEDGTIRVNDPNSPEKSAVTWKLPRLLSQTYTMWSVWKS